MSLRMKKINSTIKKAIIQIIQEEIDDPHFGFLSITKVDTTADLSESRIYFSIWGADEKAALKILQEMNSFLRVSLGKQIYLKKLPRLIFIPDDSIRYSVQINKKIDEICVQNEERENNGKGEN